MPSRTESDGLGLLVKDILEGPTEDDTKNNTKSLARSMAIGAAKGAVVGGPATAVVGACVYGGANLAYRAITKR